MDIYAKFEEGKGMATAYLWVDLGGAFSNSGEYQKQSEAIKIFMQDYYYECRRIVVQNELKEEEKNLEKLDKELAKLKKQNDGYHSDIEKAKQKILEAEKNIEQNIVDQSTKTSEIDSQKKVVEEVTKKLNSIGKQ
jgi:chromosome segregation ATPase